MTTTIQIDKSTLRCLKQLKGKFKAKTYDAVICLLVSRKLGLPVSFLGAHPGMISFGPEHHLKAHDEE